MVVAVAIRVGVFVPVAVVVAMLVFMFVFVTVAVRMVAAVGLTVLALVRMVVVVPVLVRALLTIQVPVQVRHVVIVSIVRLVEHHVEIAGVEGARRLARYLDLKAVHVQRIQRAAQAVLVGAQIQQRTHHHVGRNARGAFQIQRVTHALLSLSQRLVHGARPKSRKVEGHVRKSPLAQLARHAFPQVVLGQLRDVVGRYFDAGELSVRTVHAHAHH